MHNILYISHTSQLGGAEYSLLLLLERLDRGRFRPTVVVPGPGPLISQLGDMGIACRTAAMQRLKRTRNPAVLLRYFLMWRRMISEITRIIDELDIHLVHSNSTTAHLFASPAAKRTGVPCIWHVRDVSSPGGRLDAMMARNATAIVAISEAVKESMHHPDLAGLKMRVIYNGVDTVKFTPGDGAELRAELGLSGSNPVAGIVGQVVPWKGHQRFLDVAAKVATRMPEARFLVVGDNRFGDFPGILDRLKERAGELGIEEKIIFLGWRQDVVSVINVLDVLVVASDREPFGRVVIEAMACGKPVVSFRCGGPAEIIQHGKTGLLVRPYDLAEMADGLVRLLSRPAESARMGGLGREVARRRFSAEAYAAGVQDTYGQLLA